MRHLYKYYTDIAFTSAFDLAREIESAINYDSNHLVCFESMDNGKSFMMCFEKYEASLIKRSGYVSMTVLVKETSERLEVTVFSFGEYHDKLFAPQKTFIGIVNGILSKYGFKHEVRNEPHQL